MAVNIDKFSLPITPQEAMGILQRHTDTFGVFFDLDRILEYESDYSIKLYNLYPKFRAFMNDPTVTVTKREDILYFYRNKLRVPDRLLTGKKNKLSCDATVRKRLLESTEVGEDVKAFTYLYNDMSKLAYYRSYLGQYKKLPLCVARTYDGHRMVIGHPKWHLLNTSRLAALDPSLQNIARDLPDLLTYPSGYLMMRADSNQIEPRITYSVFILDELIKNLITLYNDAYFGILHYVLMSPAEETLYRKDFSKLNKLEITDDIKDKRQTLKLLVLAGSYGSQNLKNVDTVLADAFTRKIVNHPLRKQWEEEVIQQVSAGIETFYGAFGTPVTPEETTTYKRGTPAWPGHVIRCGINNPIQTTASELMIHSLFEADRILRNTKDSHICFYKHDEGVFYISEDEPHIVDELSEVTAYNVKGWIPIGSEVIMGKKENKNFPELWKVN